MRKLGLVIVGMFAVTALSAAPAAAKPGHGGSTCTGTLASGKYHRLVVPSGETCDGTEARIDVRGGVRANDPASLQLHFAHVSGGVRMRGGDGFFSTVEDNVISGGATINGYSGFWLGFIRNTVHGTVTLSNNHMDDRDANEYVTNRIRGSLVCHNDSPAPQIGDSEGDPNVVSGRKVGQCAGL